MFLNKKYPEIFADPAVNRHSIFSGLKPDDFTEIEQFFEDIVLQKGSVMIIDNDNPVFVIVKSGSVSCTEHIHHADTTETYELYKGGSTGSVNILKPEFADIEIRADEPVKLLALKRTALLDLSDKVSRTCNHVFLNLCNILSERIELLTARYTSIYAEKQENE